MTDLSFDLHMQFALREISLQQYRAQLKDLGWTDDEIDAALDDDGGDDD
jgi:hypothetical protein